MINKLRNIFVMICLSLPGNVYAKLSTAAILFDEQGNVSCTDGIKSKVCLHYFEKSEINFTWSFWPNSQDNNCLEIMAKFTQLSSKLSISVNKDIAPVNDNLCINEKNLKITLPSVKHESEFELTFFYRDLDKSWKEIETIPLKIYPNNILDPLKNWSKKKSNQLSLLDKSGKLAKFLDDQKIEYSINNLFPPNSSKISIVVGDGDEYQDMERDIIVLKEKVVDLPKIKARQIGDHNIVTVDMKILDKLPYDPLSQKVFMEIVEISQEVL